MKVANHFNFTASFSKPRKISCSPRLDKICCELPIISLSMIAIELISFHSLFCLAKDNKLSRLKGMI